MSLVAGREVCREAQGGEFRAIFPFLCRVNAVARGAALRPFPIEQGHRALRDLDRPVRLFLDASRENLVVPLQQQLLQFKLVALDHAEQLALI